VPFFRFLIHGTGEFADEIAGFYTTCWNWARTREAGQRKAIERVRRGLGGGTVRTLEIEEVRNIGLFQIWRTPNRGYTFYREGN
jgi:hypothetical protein